MANCLNVFLEQIVTYYSKRAPAFNLTCVPTKSNNLRSLAKELSFESFTSTVNRDCWLYTDPIYKTQYYAWIGDIKYCNCSTYCDHGVCTHIIAALNYFRQIDMGEDDEENKEFAIIRKRGRKTNVF